MTEDAAAGRAAAPMVGDHPALDFLNSVFLPAAEPVELLADGAALLRWLRASGVLDAAVVQAAARLDAEALDAAAGGARALREAFRAIVARWSEGGGAALRPVDLARLNRLLAKGTVRQRLVAGGGPGAGPVVRTEPVIDGADGLVAALAACCASLLAGLAPADVRRCENPACTLWFADTRRGPRRRWCAMALCGNRMKVAAHRARQKAG